MRAFWAIVRLTLKNAIRSHIFQLLLTLLVLCIFLIPNTVTGDGTARGFIQISLKYSLASVAFVLSLSSVWLGCYIMTRDVESYQLHMVVSKPVSRITIWLGKWTGICLMNGILLLAAASAVYLIVMYQFSQRTFSQGEKARIKTEVMTGRRVLMPEVPDFDKIARQELPQRIKLLRAEGLRFDENKLLKEMRKELFLKYCEIPYKSGRDWMFENLPFDKEGTIFVRYRFYVNKISSEKQRMTHGMWVVGVPVPVRQKSGNVFERDKLKGEVEFYPRALTQKPQQYMTGVFHEFKLKGGIVSPKGEARMSYVNVDDLRYPVYMQLADGPKMLIRVTGFFENYCRGIVIMLLQLIILAGLSCAAASFLSMPTAVFMVISYMIFGSVASFTTSQGHISGTMDNIGFFVSKVLLFAVIPIQNFEVTQFLANGELIELSFMGRIFFSYFVLRALPFILVGIWLYWRRQMGLVIRK
ncbi:hypothetical protein P0136_01005 [Lentisphaerota bacterium ZTH]|nr:hypothetical protein JYG24_07855 [Lentisphaerota bacterium]WET06591.1 hypothetical protein P0136_01005 [Lentisphaerota bacterium ZTH]